MTWKKVILEGQGASLYCLGEGKGDLEQVEREFQVLIWPQQERRSRLEAAIRRAGIAASSTRGSSPDQAPTSSPLSHADLEVVLGSLEKQQVQFVALVIYMHLLYFPFRKPNIKYYIDVILYNNTLCMPYTGGWSGCTNGQHTTAILCVGHLFEFSIKRIPDQL